MFTAESAVLYPAVWVSWWLLNIAVTALFSRRYQLSAHQVQLIVRVFAYSIIPLLIIVGSLMDPTRPLSSAELNPVESCAVVMMVCYFFYDISAYARLDKAQTQSDTVHHWFLAYSFFLGYENGRIERGLLLALLVMVESPPWSLSLIIRELPDAQSALRLRQRYRCLQWNEWLYVLTKFVHLPVLSTYFVFRHLATFPEVSVEDGIYLIGVPVINGLNVLWYTQRRTMIDKVGRRCEEAEAALLSKGKDGEGKVGEGRERNGHSSNGNGSGLHSRNGRTSQVASTAVNGAAAHGKGS